MNEVTYANDRRKHKHRCQCCRKIVSIGEQVLLYRITGGSRVLHVLCADRPSFDGLTFRQLGELHEKR